MLNSVKAWLGLAEMATVLWLWSWLRASTSRAPEELESGRALWRQEALQREVEASGLRRADGAVEEEKMFLGSFSDLTVCPDGWEEWCWVERQMAVFISQGLGSPTCLFLSLDLAQCQHLSQS